MGMKCDNCQKGVMYGHNVSHAKNRTKRLFLPNLHFVKVMIEGSPRGEAEKMQRMRLCTKCTRMLKKKAKMKSSKIQAPIAPSAVV